METGPMINALTGAVREQRARALAIAHLPTDQLLYRPAPGAWNTLEVFEHLNLSGSIYARGLESVFDRKAHQLQANPVFTPGLLGNWFTEGLKPANGDRIRWRMRTFKMFDPARQQGASLESIGHFIQLCDRWLGLLDRARTTDLNRMRVTSSLGPLVRFKAGDALRFPVAHQQRHFLQIERALRTFSNNERP